MKNFILMFIIFLPFHSFSQTQVVLESGKIINDKVNSFLNGKLIFDEIESIDIVEVTQLNGSTPKHRKKEILKKNPNIFKHPNINYILLN